VLVRSLAGELPGVVWGLRDYFTLSWRKRHPSGAGEVILFNLTLTR